MEGKILVGSDNMRAKSEGARFLTYRGSYDNNRKLQRQDIYISREYPSQLFTLSYAVAKLIVVKLSLQSYLGQELKAVVVVLRESKARSKSGLIE